MKSNLTAWDYVASAGGIALAAYSFKHSGAARYVMLGASAWLLFGVYQDYIG